MATTASWNVKEKLFHNHDTYMILVLSVFETPGDKRHRVNFESVSCKSLTCVRGGRSRGESMGPVERMFFLMKVISHLTAACPTRTQLSEWQRKTVLRHRFRSQVGRPVQQGFFSKSALA